MVKELLLFGILSLYFHLRIFYFSPAGQKHKDIEAELLTPRRMVAAFDYNPKESSPNTDVEVTTSCFPLFRDFFFLSLFSPLSQDTQHFGPTSLSETV